MKKNRLFVRTITNMALGEIVQAMPVKTFLNIRYVYSSLVDFQDHRLMHKLHVNNLSWVSQLHSAKQKQRIYTTKAYRQYNLKGCNLRR